MGKFEKITTRFHVMSKEEAEAFLAAYLEAMPRRLQEFKESIGKAGGPPVEALDGTRESLVPLWTWIVATLRPGPLPGPDDALPMWFDVDQESYGGGLPLNVLWAGDGVAYYVASVMQREYPGLRWCIGSRKTWNSAHRNKPILTCGPREMEFDPIHICVGIVAAIFPHPFGNPERHRRPTALRDIVDAWADVFR